MSEASSALPAGLAATHAASFPEGQRWSADEFASLLSGAGVSLFGDAEAFLLGRIVAGEGEVLTLATHPSRRRQGLARVFLDQFLATCAENGCEQVFLEVAHDNLAAQALYRAAGFAEVGLRKNYYHLADGRRLNALVMRRELAV